MSDENHYLTHEYITFEEFSQEMTALLAKEANLLRQYEDVYMRKDTPEDVRARMKSYMDLCAESVAANALILQEAVESAEYCIFMRDIDGYPMVRQVPPALKKRIAQKMKEVRNLYV